MTPLSTGAAAATVVRELGHDLVVDSVRRRPGDAVSIRFLPPAGGDFGYHAGQFITVRVPSPGGPVARCYSLSSAPGVDDLLEITVKRIGEGGASAWLVEHAAPGTTLRAIEPSGLFVPATAGERLLLIAAGSGITPIFSIARWTLETGEGTVLLIAIDRDRTTSIFGDDLAALAEAHPDRLTLLTWSTAEAGRPTADDIRRLAGVRPWDDAFVCGPDGLLDIVRAAVPGDRERLHVEEYESLAGDPFVLADEPDGDATVAAEVLLDGVEHQLDWPVSATLVDELLRRGVRVPYSCREGECGSCMSRLVRGRVEMASTDALEAEDLDDGYILACQSRPVEGPLRIEF